MPDEPASADMRSEASAKKKRRRNAVCALSLVTALALVGGLAGGLLASAWAARGDGARVSTRGGDVTGGHATLDGPDVSETDATTSEGDAGHVHDWSAVYALRDVPAVTHVEHHDAVYGTETSYETVCNVCDAVVTGATREHTEETGHAAFTTDVPVENEIVEQEAYDETVVDSPATVQLVHTSDRCFSCGEVRDVEDEVVQTVDGSASQE